MGRVVGQGLTAFGEGAVRGVVHRFSTPADVLDVIDKDLEDTIALVESGGTTFLSPILGRLGGVICTSGTLRSHLAIVSREYQLPCLMAVQLTEPLESGVRVSIVIGGDGDGRVQRDEDLDGSLTHRWWSWIRRPGDELGYKPWEPGKLTPADVDTLIAEQLDDERLNDLILHMGVGFKPELTRRSSFTSELFPMAPYICVSLIEDFHTYPERVAAIESAKSAQEIARANRATPATLSPLWIWMVGYHYLCGRECLIQMGELKPDERIDEVRGVVDFWRRLTLAQRADGTLNNKDAGDANPYLPDAVVAAYEERALPLDDATRRTFRRLNATLAGYAFLYYTDSRVGVYDSGPYELDGDRLLIVRDYLQLGHSAFPWSDGRDVPHDALSIGLVAPRERLRSLEINDWGTSFSDPEQLLDAVSDVAVQARVGDDLVPIPPAEWDSTTKAFSRAHLELYEHFARMPRRDLVLSAATMYCWGLMPFARDAGVFDRINWEISPATMRFYPDPLDDDAAAGAIFGGALITHDRPSAFSPIR